MWTERTLVNKEVEKKNKVSERFREVRRTMGLTQQQMADRLFLTRNYIAKIESGFQEPAARVIRDLEALRVDAGNTSSTTRGKLADYRNSGSSDASLPAMVEERSASMLDPRFQPRAEPTPEMCIAHLQSFLASAVQQPGGVGYTWHQLQKHFPLDEFERKKTDPT